MLAPPCQLRLNQPGLPQASSAFGAETCGLGPPTALLSASEEAKRTGYVETVSSRGNWVVVTVLCHRCSKWRSSHPGCSSCAYGKASLTVSWQDIPRPHWQVEQPSSLLCSCHVVQLCNRPQDRLEGRWLLGSCHAQRGRCTGSP